MQQSDWGLPAQLTVRRHPFFKGIDWQALEEKLVKPPDKEKVGVKFVF
jgi:hypothetical protein